MFNVLCFVLFVFLCCLKGQNLSVIIALTLGYYQRRQGQNRTRAGQDRPDSTDVKEGKKKVKEILSL